jgi:hypothetical protein
MPKTRHFPTTLGTGSTCLDAFIHTAKLLAIHRACLADFGTDFAKTMLKMRVTELKVGRCLANLGAVHQETEVFSFNVLSAGHKTVVHGGLQTDLMAMATSLNTGLHALFSMGRVIHGILLR